ncbi:MAG: tRNA (N(6)-L-threonylcarbamoyladenosine(37)-C(2))-methylthiotransferase MtaB [Nitrospinae bacterium CG11_big_fil_rev_8_21_14_0_20_56_8]|nr:MAG: tRNA (N(6)-L-threonylcarbamoyladenosine(37)-C(2))-methylthiotransferase MtaB [Nitrospinae bacterium CG11_big_fil_rev_8_21_14_0_20_56_8]
MRPKVGFATLGCRTNQNDTAEMQTLLEQEGFEIVSPEERADVYVINTCTVTARSDHHSRLAAKKSLSINENALVVFTGCYAQLNPEEASRLKGLDIVLGNANKLEVARVIRERMEADQPLKSPGSAQVYMDNIQARRRFRTIPVTRFQGRTKAFVKVQTGCEEKCSFCTVVRARGRSLSDSRENILNNIRQTLAAGFKEITLTGINLGTWGMDFTPRETFSSLVRDVLRQAGDYRVRLSSINPMEIDDALIAMMRDDPRLCPHLHIPLQSGNDEILRRMRRNYDSRQYREVVERAASRIPNLGLGADIIVGFPGETQEQFENTRRMVEDLPFAYLHVFSYSPRKGTEAYDHADDVPKSAKKERHRILTDLAQEKCLAFRRGLLNTTATVLVEYHRDPSTRLLRGYTEHYLPVQLEGEDTLGNHLVQVKLKEVDDQRVYGCRLS